MYTSIDNIFDDWCEGKQLTPALIKKEFYTQEEIIQTAYNTILKNNSTAKDAEAYLKNELQEHLPAWLEQHANKQPDGTYKITSALQRRQ